MKLKKLLLFAIIGMLIVSCNQEKSIKEYMVNSWETVDININMPTFKNADSTFVFKDDFKNNPPRRARSTYKKDGTFTAWYVNQQEEKKGETTGKWSVVNDSLFIEYTAGAKDVKVGYQITKTEEGFIGVSKSDWDEDGKKDDLLTMKTKRLTLEN
jgi:hypothetical protein